MNIPGATSASSYNIAILDDHPPLAELLGNFIEEQTLFKVAGVASRPEDCLGLCAGGRVDLVVLDLGLPEATVGIDTLRRIRDLYPKIKVLVFSACNSAQIVQEALKIGACGFLEKSAKLCHFSEAIERVARGEVYLGSKISEILREVMRRGIITPRMKARDIEVLQRLAQGFVVKEIAEELEVSASIVYKQLDRLRREFSAKTNEDLVVLAIEQGSIKVDRPSIFTPQFSAVL